MDVQSNWWEQFFEGLAVKLWLQALSPESTRREADVIERALAATSGARTARCAVRRRPALAGAGRARLPCHWRGPFVRIPGACTVLPGCRARDVGTPRHAGPAVAGPFRRRILCGEQLRLPGRRRKRRLLEGGIAVLKPGLGSSWKRRWCSKTCFGISRTGPGGRSARCTCSLRIEYDHTRSRLDIEYRFLSNGRTEVRHGSHRAYRYAELCELIESIVDSMLRRPRHGRATRTP